MPASTSYMFLPAGVVLQAAIRLDVGRVAVTNATWPTCNIGKVQLIVVNALLLKAQANILLWENLG